MAAIVDDLRIAYFPIPKCACSSVKTVFYQLKFGREFDPKRYNDVGYIHRIFQSFKFERSFSEVPSEYQKIAVVRDPIERFLSAFYNRVVARESDRAAEFAKAGVALPRDVNDLVNRLEECRSVSQDIHRHTLPMAFFLGSDASYFTRLFYVSELDNMLSWLEDLSGRKLTLPHMMRSDGGKRSDELSDPSRDILREFYSEDYKFLAQSAASKEREQIRA